ncbi:MAG: wax ester/triacylglycerol synthase domain-containing protein [Dermatophilaceae bacterium]
MEQLSGLDGALLAMETRSVFGQVGSVCIVDALASRGTESRMTLQHLTEVIESHLTEVIESHLTEVIESRPPLVPLFGRQLVTVPFGLGHPYWIEDPDLDIELHVRELALPSPGNDRQLSEQPPDAALLLARSAVNLARSAVNLDPVPALVDGWG